MEWSSAESRWTAQVTRTDTGERLRYSADFLWMCQGYYNHDEPYRPKWKGMDRFRGVIVHPQKWPNDLDHAGKRVLVIGSGSTAATVIPALRSDRRACHDAAALALVLLPHADDA